MGDIWVSAGDVEKYGYCPLSWWLSYSEEDPDDPRLEEGITKHKEISKGVSEVKGKQEKAREVENIVLWLALSATIVSIAGLTLLRPERLFRQILQVTAMIWLLSATFLLLISEMSSFKKYVSNIEKVILIFAIVASLLILYSFTLGLFDPTTGQVMQVLSLSWLIGASYWVKVSLSIKKETREKKNELSLGEGEIKYVDELGKEIELLVSEKYGLRGRPDYIKKIDGELIPVEVKTGRIPKGPFFSHVLQSAAYCLLVEDVKDKKPPYGIVKYGETEYKVDYEDELKELLLEKIEEMRSATKTGDVHRNHNRKGKCLNCSRRSICPEKIA